ncbi:PREDICTED: calcium-binding protein P-like [Papilio xuthus]|uniref:Calcium-binding protein P-like n=1 Tax=Papilio xuthus TaxID=66420 RepID=A0AAJ6ZKD2_PAPXU|nr:PREDICTED: calcium-binding protein P-like [Papilio xuthus]
MGNAQPGRVGPFTGGPFGGHPSGHPQDVYRPPGPYPPPDRGQIESFPYQSPPTPFAQGYTDNRQNAATQYPQQDAVSPQAYQQGYQQGYQPYPQQPPGYPPPGYPQAYPQQGYPPQGYPYQQYPPPQPPSMAQTTFCAACMACLTCLMCSCCQGLMGVPGDDSIAESAGPTGGQPQVSPPGAVGDDD